MRHDDDIAAVVRAYSFILIDPRTGQDIAVQSGGFFAGSVPYADIRMEHHDPLTTDSLLLWTQDEPVQNQELTAIYGPTAVGLEDTNLTNHPQLVTQIAGTGTGAAVTTAALGSGRAQNAADPTAIVEATSAGPTTGAAVDLQASNVGGFTAHVHVAATNVAEQVQAVATGPGGTAQLFLGAGATLADSAALLAAAGTVQLSATSGNVVLQPAGRVLLGARPVLLMVEHSYVQCTSNTFLATYPTYSLINGVAAQFNLLIGDVVHVFATIDVEQSSAGPTSAFAMSLQVNGVQFGSEVVSNATAAINTDVTMSNQWEYTAPATGNYLFRMAAATISGGVTLFARSPHSSQLTAAYAPR